MGCVSWGVIGIVYLLALSWVNEKVVQSYGDTASETFIVSVVGITALVLIINSVRQTNRVRQLAARIIRYDRDFPDSLGKFGSWNERQGHDGDEMTVRFAANALVQAYGGPAVINLLVREGYLGIFEDDLLDVFDGERAGRILNDVLAASSKLPLAVQIGAFATGAFFGYKATTRR